MDLISLAIEYSNSGTLKGNVDIYQLLSSNDPDYYNDSVETFDDIEIDKYTQTN